MGRALLVVILLSTAGHAEPDATQPATDATQPATDATPPTHAAPLTSDAMRPADDNLTAAQLTAQARVAARRGQCDVLPGLGERVRALDIAYYEREFTTDREITYCGMAPPPHYAGPGATPASPAAPVDLENAGDKSAAVAAALSCGIPAVGLLVSVEAGMSGRSRPAAAVFGIAGAALFFVGPTLGHVYAGRTWNTGLKLRLITLGVAVPAFALTESDHGSAAAAIVFMVAGVGYLGATIYEMVDAPLAVDRANRVPRRIAIVPAVSNGAGLSVVGRF